MLRMRVEGDLGASSVDDVLEQLKAALEAAVEVKELAK